MDAKKIVDLANRLKKEFFSEDPFEIAHALEIKVVYCKRKKLAATGYIFRSIDDPVIVINENYDYISQKIFCAHELGHALLHRDHAINHFDGNSSVEIEKLEYEANLFAAALLFKQEDLDIKLVNMSNYQLKALLDYNIS